MANKTSKLNGWSWQIETDPNYPDNLNLTLIKPDNKTWTKEEHKEVKILIKKLGLDQEPIMPGMYSFDAPMREMVRHELGLIGMAEFVEISTYVPDFSDPVCNESCSDNCDCREQGPTS